MTYDEWKTEFNRVARYHMEHLGYGQLVIEVYATGLTNDFTWRRYYESGLSPEDAYMADIEFWDH